MLKICLILIVAIIVSLLLLWKSIKDDIIENNDFIRKFRELASTDSFISNVLKKSGCNEQSLPLENPESLKDKIEYVRKTRNKRNEIISLLEMPCITTTMEVKEILDLYAWCKNQGEKACSKCCKNKPQEFSLLNQEGYTDTNYQYDNFWNPYFGCHVGVCCR